MIETKRDRRLGGSPGVDMIEHSTGRRHPMTESAGCLSCFAEPPLVVVDLFAGEGNWSRPAADRGHKVWSSDFDPVYGTDHVGDVRELTGEQILEAVGGKVDLLVGSPPCQGFTVVRIGTNWSMTRTASMIHKYPHLASESEPMTEKAALGMELVAAMLRIVEEVKPRWWLMENPVGKLRKLNVVAGLPHRMVTYCRYGRPFRKPTDLWGEAPPTMEFEQPCDAYNAATIDVDGVPYCKSKYDGRPCHPQAPRGSVTGVQGHKRLTSTAIPYPLAWDVIRATEVAVEHGFEGGSARQMELI